jgi:hypothetical protein
LLVELGEQVQQFPNATAEPIEAGDEHDVAPAERGHQLGQFRNLQCNCSAN